MENCETVATIKEETDALGETHNDEGAEQNEDKSKHTHVPDREDFEHNHTENTESNFHSRDGASDVGTNYMDRNHKQDAQSLKDKFTEGEFLEIDLKDSHSLHENQCPLASESAIDGMMLSASNMEGNEDEMDVCHVASNGESKGSDIKESLEADDAGNSKISNENLSDEEGEQMKNNTVQACSSPINEIGSVGIFELASGEKPAEKTLNKSFLLEPSMEEGYESGTEEEQTAFRQDVESFYRDSCLEFKAPKFYKEDLNLLKLWRAVIKLGGYEQVTSCKLWRQVGESFRPPKTCTTVSWTFRNFYEKALLEYEKHKLRSKEPPNSEGAFTDCFRVEESQVDGNQAGGSGRARRDAAARAMQGWHSQRYLDSGQVCDPVIKEKNLSPATKGDKQQKSNGLMKRKKPPSLERTVNLSNMKTVKSQVDMVVRDIGPPADWVKINVQRTNDCFEVYALVPGLLREEVHVQSDPAGRLIISGQPEQPDNPWGITPFKKVVTLPCRIDPHHTSAVVTLHGQLFVRVPFEQPDA